MHSSVNPTVYLSPFHNLSYLEVRNIDIDHLVHLSKLRGQLRTLVIHSFVKSLDDVLLRCGGDKSVDSFLWSELHSLHITGCDSLELNTGLQFAPWLKTLDLSSDCLTDYSIRSLDTLFSINQLTLNFNHLLKVPALAVSAKSSLRILHLRQNHLESLTGINCLSFISSNCLNSCVLKLFFCFVLVSMFRFRASMCSRRIGRRIQLHIQAQCLTAAEFFA